VAQVGANLIGRSLGFIALAIVARQVTASDLGAFGFAMSVMTLASGLALPGANVVATRQAAEHSEPIQSIVSRLLATNAIATALITLPVTLAAVALTSSGQTRTLLLLVLPIAFISSIDTRWQLLFASKGRSVAVTYLIGQVVYFVGVLLWFVAGHGTIEAYAILNVFGLLLTAGINNRLTASQVGSIRPRVNRSQFTSMARAAIGPGVTLLVAIAYSQSGMILLGMLSTESEVGKLLVATRIPVVISTLGTLWAANALPRLAEANQLTDSGDERRVNGWYLSVTLPVSLAVIGLAAANPNGLISWAFGADYRGLGNLYILCLVFAALSLVASTITFGLLAQAKGKVAAVVGASALAANLIVGVALIPALGASGAAIATIATESVIVVGTFAHLSKANLTPQLVPATLGKGLLAATLSCLTGAAVGQLTGGPIGAIAAGVVFASAFMSLRTMEYPG
jgi:O-antigen/teichoic acid export membrane protein